MSYYELTLDILRPDGSVVAGGVRLLAVAADEADARRQADTWVDENNPGQEPRTARVTSVVELNPPARPSVSGGLG